MPMMKRVRCREVLESFGGHIDGLLSAAELHWPSGEAFLAIRYYPWWQHPLYRQAVEKGESWGFDLPDEAYKEVRIYPLDLLEIRLRAGADYTNVCFTQTHPLLWAFEQEGQLFCNEPTDLANLGHWVLTQVAGEWAERAEEYLHSGFFSDGARELGKNQSFSLRLPRTVHVIVRERLTVLGKEHFVAREPPEQPAPWMFHVDDENYLIADDFEVAMPEFEYRDEWFKPHGSSVSSL
jgi:hypothetical protein